MDIVKRIDQRFDDVKAIVLTEEEWIIVRKYINSLKLENERLKWTLNTQD